ncbi:IRG-type G domain-containing protein [Trichoderma simmonsii]|uniref:IRG-type G domain-containing protein n=1 Tax=Trichoderma simmonsii TaxID=1491479 RepID=A0A8G0LR54_9HYPO|nr:IRG-type G domain-containing protein [Trichoderma simmonsii]
MAAIPIGALIGGNILDVIGDRDPRIKAERERELRQQAERRVEEERQRAEKERQDREALEQYMRDLGIDPADPDISDSDIEDARRDINYDAAVANIAVAGSVNAGKSLLLNAIRNLSYGDPDWAPTGGSAVTRQRHRYPDPAHNCVWYDLPGAGTQRVTAFSYYYSQKLFAYDKIVLVHETTLTESDIRLLRICEHFKQPCIVVRTKSDIHIYNYTKEREWTWVQAKETFLSEARQDVARFRGQVEASQAKFVPDFDDFVVSTSGIRGFVRKERSPKELDEARFFEELERKKLMS